MKKYIPLNKVVPHIKDEQFITWLDKLKFTHIFLLWVLVVIIFGGFYFKLSGDNSFIFYNSPDKQLNGLADSIYFSFITATSTGFGDILPFGSFKFIAIIEVIFGLLLLAVVTSKLVSIKQTIILNEIYELSFNERINRLRSSLLLFRQNLSRIMGVIETGKIKKREVSDVYIHISLLEDALFEISEMMKAGKSKLFTKGIDPVSTQLLYNSINHSLEKLAELLIGLNLEQKEWKRAVTLNIIKRCLKMNNDLFDRLTFIKKIDAAVLKELSEENKKIVSSIENDIKEQIN